MKKLLALTLAVAMIVSLAAVSFAAKSEIFLDASGFTITTVPMTLDEGKLVLVGTDNIAVGETLYIAFLGTKGTDKVLVRDSSTTAGLKIKQTWEMNKASIKGVTVQKKEVTTDAYNALKAEATQDGGMTGAAKYIYCIAIETTGSDVTSAKDVIGELAFAKSATDSAAGTKNNDKLTYDDNKYPVSFAVGYEIVKNELNVGTTKQIHEFDSMEEEEFAILDDAATFTVNLSGQGKVVMSASAKFNADIAAKYPEGNLDFLSMNNATFNRTGELRIFAPANTHLYKVSADGILSKVSAATYDDVDESFVVKTRTLGSYVISDVELTIVPEAPVVPETPVVPGTETPINPGTGAIA